VGCGSLDSESDWLRSRVLDADFGCWQILLQKSFWGAERKFLEPLKHSARGDVREHIVLSKTDHGPP
jgi:hypothetical protein